ncbi:beta-lactamase class C [Bradyrhizobium diazoefficiens]|uniref:Serine hydrolase n=2 Tax=Nitrobacteraceae TaxID=41294 RepID=A0A809XW32_9BRAD|nr:beta-lactamase class C [Bradyrhizobium japonicum]BCA05066.1 serine hydrolase [Bradyrhizobium diazoefficiens]BCA22421.1 serine hydrolase [Bradyrhizobium diazoefficiens]BCE31797.1 serine hydrolase [Bradyrhizobium diazoefficiens]BCE40581.1 serine hydrolase [Bradyrhizobium diazoefficiens]
MSSLVTLRSLSISRRGFAKAALLPLAIGLIRPREAAADSDMIAQMRDIVANELAPTATPDQPGGLAAALYAGRHVEFFNYGFADDTTRRPVTSDTLFNLGSLRKPFEATLVALGTLRGELRLDDRLPKYLPELTGDSIRRVTVGELVTHTSGLLLPTDHPPWPNEEFSRAQFIEMLNAWRPQAGEAPGKQRIYSHAGYVLLQLVLERCYGTPIATQLEQRIFKPLGMTATSVPERGEDNRAVMDAAWMQRVVQGYSDQGMAIGPPGNQQSYFDFPGTGQIFSSPRDLSTFVAACVDSHSVDPHLREALRMTQHEAFRVDEKFGQGMAWETVHLPEATVVDKPGGLNNASGYLGLVPARRIGIVLLANRGEYPHEIARYRILPALAKLVASH